MTERGENRSAIRRLNVTGLAILLLLVCGAGGWAAVSEVTGAVIAAGQVVVESEVKTVQHPSGGVVGQIHVAEGDFVEAGDLLIRLDSTLARAELQIVTSRLDEFYARQAVLEAVRDKHASLTFPVRLISRSDDPTVADVLASARSTFGLQAAVQRSRENELRSQIEQSEQELRGLARQTKAKVSELELVEAQLTNIRELLTSGLIEKTEVTRLERDAARLSGEIGQIESTQAVARGRVNQQRLQLERVSQDIRSEAATELQSLGADIAEYEERRIAAMDQLQRLDVTAPQSGVVHELEVHTVGGVIGVGDALMKIVPRADELIVEARVSPPDRDQLFAGQKASLHFSAFNQRTTPRVDGVVRTIAATTSFDTRTGSQFYIVRIAMTADATTALAGNEVLPGMPVSAFIETEPRTVASFLLKPLMDQAAAAFRER